MQVNYKRQIEDKDDAWLLSCGWTFVGLGLFHNKEFDPMQHHTKQQALDIQIQWIKFSMEAADQEIRECLIGH
jgi:hypothetical protein